MKESWRWMGLALVASRRSTIFAAGGRGRFAAPAALGRGDKARPSASVEEAALFRRGRRRRGPPGAPAVGPDVRRAGGRAGLVTQAEWSGLGQARLGAAPGGFAPMRLGPCAC